MHRFTAWVFLGLAACAVTAQAIVRRHDREEGAYLALAQSPKWQSAVSVGGVAVGTLVGETWVLTAAHVAQVIGPFERVVRVAGRECVVSEIYTHQGYDGSTAGTDIALLRLAKPVTDVMPAPFYPDSDEAGRAVIFVGDGQPGVGTTGPVNETDRRWRAAENRITRAQDTTLQFDFDAPPDGEQLEGISGPGDSGGPAFIEKGGRVFVAGVSSANLRGTGPGLCTYGTIEVYCRVSAQRAWIDAVLSGKTPPDDRWSGVNVLARAGWPKTPRFERMREWFAVRNRGDAEALSQFMETAASPGYLAARPAEARVRAAKTNWENHGAIEPVAFAEAKDGTISVLARTSRPGHWVDIIFTFEGDGVQFNQAGTLALGARTDFGVPL